MLHYPAYQHDTSHARAHCWTHHHHDQQSEQPPPTSCAATCTATSGASCPPAGKLQDPLLPMPQTPLSSCNTAQLPDGLQLATGLGSALLLADGWLCCCTGVLDRDATTGVLTPEHGVEQRGLSAPLSPCRAAVLRLNSMLLLLGSVMGLPCSSSMMTLMLSELERRSARSTRARDAADAGPCGSLRLTARVRRATWITSVLSTCTRARPVPTKQRD
jgi:hypothetical protein